MKYYRYMSTEEFFGMLNEKEIKPLQTYENCRTGDKNGVCFIGEETKFKTNSDRERFKETGGEVIFSPDECFEFLRGCVSENVLVEFETNAWLRETWGEYSDPYGEWEDTITINEYRIDSYSTKDFEPIRFCFPAVYEKPDWRGIDDVLSLAEEMKDNCAFENEYVRIFVIPEYACDIAGDIPLCHMSHYSEKQDMDVPCVITFDEWDKNVTITVNNDDFSIKDELIENIRERADYLEGICKQIEEFGRDYGLQFRLENKDDFQFIAQVVTEIIEEYDKENDKNIELIND